MGYGVYLVHMDVQVSEWQDRFDASEHPKGDVLQSDALDVYKDCLADQIAALGRELIRIELLTLEHTEIDLEVLLTRDQLAEPADPERPHIYVVHHVPRTRQAVVVGAADHL